MENFSASPDTQNQTMPQQTPPREKMLNVPPLTLGLTLVITACFLLWYYGGAAAEHMLVHLVFVPSLFTLDPVYYAYTLVTYGLLHFNWTHLLVNGTGLLAFGSGIERLMGKKYVLAIFIGGTIIGVLGYWTIYPNSDTPLIGASAGISALFGGLLPLIVKRPQILMASFIFILMNIVLGLMGMPDDPMRQANASIAWQAHIAGFLFGEFLVLGLIRFKIARYKAARKQDDEPASL